LEAFEAGLTTPQARSVKADALDAALAQMARAAPELVQAPSGNQEGPSQVLARFLTATEQGDFRTAYHLLSARWRGRYTVDRLAADFAVEPLARDRVARARATLSAGPQVAGDQIRFPMGSTRAVVLVREPEGYRVAELE
jgi:hypothetical protein